MAIYIVKTSDGAGFRMKYNAEHPEFAICIDCNDDGSRQETSCWVTTPHQVADATDARHAAELALEYLDDGSHVISVEEMRTRR